MLRIRSHRWRIRIFYFYEWNIREIIWSIIYFLLFIFSIICIFLSWSVFQLLTALIGFQLLKHVFIMSAILLLSACLILQGAFTVSILICQNSGFCKNSADCYPGNKCGNIHENLYYSQCIADPNTYSTVPGCLTNFGGMCIATSQCCDPGSSCDLSDKYPQCKQPTAATGLKSTLKF